MKKKRIRIYFICILVIILYCLLDLLHDNRLNSDATTAVNNMEIKNEQYLLKIYKEDGSIWYDIEVNYPQLFNTLKSGSVEKANILLKDAAFSIYGKTYNEAKEHLKESEKGIRYESSVMVEYDILQLSDDYISLIFCMDSFGWKAVRYQYLVTIDINNGEYISLTDLEDSLQMERLVESGNFQVMEGTYSELHEDFFHEPEVIKRLVKMLKDELKNNKLNDGFDIVSSQNIGIDEENLYLYLRFDEAFHGYVILRVPWEWKS